MAVAPSQVQFAQEVRPYALMTMVSLAAAWALVSFERGGANSWRLVAFAIALLAMMLTHYFLAGVAAALVAYGSLRTRGVARRNLLIAVAIATAVFVLAWGPSMWAQRAAFADENTDFLNDEGPGRVLRTVARVAALPPRLFTEFLGGKVLPSILLGGIVLFAAWLARRRDDLLLWCLWLGGAVGLIAFVDLTRSTRHLHFLRYTLVAAPALYAIAATLLWPARGIARHLLPGVVMLTCAVMLPAAPLTMWKANWRDLAPLMADQSHPGDILVIAPSDDDLTYPRNAYLCLSHYAPEPLVPFVLLQEKADDRLLQQLKGAPGVLLLMPLDATVAPYADVLGECHAEPLAVAIGAGRLWRITWTSERSPAE